MVKLSGVEMVDIDAAAVRVIDYVENKGALRATYEQLLSMGPESGIVDGDSPSISLSYIDKTVYKCTHTCVYSVSTESMCHQLSLCLVACYLSSTHETEFTGQIPLVHELQMTSNLQKDATLWHLPSALVAVGCSCTCH